MHKRFLPITAAAVVTLGLGTAAVQAGATVLPEEETTAVAASPADGSMSIGHEQAAIEHQVRKGERKAWRRAVRAHEVRKLNQAIWFNAVAERQAAEAAALRAAAAAQAAEARAAAAPSYSYSGGAGGTLAAIRACESGGNYGAVSSTGRYRGAYQFSYETWAAVGGSGDPAAASPSEQDYRAGLLLARSGSGNWPICGR